MEVFSLLKYWKGGGDGGRGGGGGFSGSDSRGGATTGCSTCSTASFATASGEHSADDDDGPFFDLEFTDEQPKKTTSSSLEKQSEIIYEERDEVVEEENDVVRGVEEELKSPSFRNADSPARTATKLRVLMLRLKRSNSESTATTTTQSQNQNQNQQNDNKKKLFTVKFKAEVPIMSLLSRASANSKVNTEVQPVRHEFFDEKRLKKRDQAVQKYLKMVKRVSKRHQEAEEAAAVTAAIKRLNLNKKSKSAVAHSDSVVPTMNTASKRRDDSLLQHEDGIQSAILHCKRSFNAPSPDVRC